LGKSAHPDVGLRKETERMNLFVEDKDKQPHGKVSLEAHEDRIIYYLYPLFFRDKFRKAKQHL
jgi:hypothetical protein